MRTFAIGVCAVATVAAALWAGGDSRSAGNQNDPVVISVEKGARWASPLLSECRTAAEFLVEREAGG